jgi:hypothetical protein
MNQIMYRIFVAIYEFLKISAEDRNAAWEKVKFSNAIIAEPKFYFETEGVREAKKFIQLR